MTNESKRKRFITTSDVSHVPKPHLRSDQRTRRHWPSTRPSGPVVPHRGVSQLLGPQLQPGRRAAVPPPEARLVEAAALLHVAVHGAVPDVLPRQHGREGRQLAAVAEAAAEQLLESQDVLLQGLQV